MSFVRLPQCFSVISTFFGRFSGRLPCFGLVVALLISAPYSVAQVAPVVTTSGGVTIDADQAAVGGDTVYLLETRNNRLHRWSLADREYLSVVELGDSPTAISYSDAHDTLYIAYERSVTRIYPQRSLDEHDFIAGYSRELCGIVATANFLLLCSERAIPGQDRIGFQSFDYQGNALSPLRSEGFDFFYLAEDFHWDEFNKEVCYRQLRGNFDKPIARLSFNSMGDLQRHDRDVSCSTGGWFVDSGMSRFTSSYNSSTNEVSASHFKKNGAGRSSYSTWVASYEIGDGPSVSIDIWNENVVVVTSPSGMPAFSIFNPGEGDLNGGDYDDNGTPDRDENDYSGIVDVDGDSLGNDVDQDDDGDSIVDWLDVAPNLVGVTSDFDGDGIDDKNDSDKDNDGYVDSSVGYGDIADAYGSDLAPYNSNNQLLEIKGNLNEFLPMQIGSTWRLGGSSYPDSAADTQILLSKGDVKVTGERFLNGDYAHKVVMPSKPSGFTQYLKSSNGALELHGIKLPQAKWKQKTNVSADIIFDQKLDLLVDRGEGQSILTTATAKFSGGVGTKTVYVDASSNVVGHGMIKVRGRQVEAVSLHVNMTLSTHSNLDEAFMRNPSPSFLHYHSYRVWFARGIGFVRFDDQYIRDDKSSGCCSDLSAHSLVSTAKVPRGIDLVVEVEGRGLVDGGEGASAGVAPLLCSGICAHTYAWQGNTFLMGHPAPGWELQRWEGCSSIDNNRCYVEIDQHRTVKAIFASKQDSDLDGIADYYEAAYGLQLGADDASADADGDGVSNLQEYIDGTRSNTTDSDGDGLSDLDEKTAGSNPLASDSDSDGMSDGFEIEHGFNPLDSSDAVLDADSDGLTNAREAFLGGNPHHYDSDGDGLDDAYEEEQGLSISEPNPEAFADYLSAAYPHDYQWQANLTNLDTLGEGGTLLYNDFWTRGTGIGAFASARGDSGENRLIFCELRCNSWQKSAHDFNDDGVYLILDAIFDSSDRVWYVMAQTTGDEMFIYRSTDFDTWSIVYRGYYDENQIGGGFALSDDKIVAVGLRDEFGTQNLIASSSDGILWDESNPVEHIDWSDNFYKDRGLEQKFQLNSIAYGLGKFIAVGAAGVMLESTDGINWKALNWKQVFSKFQDYPNVDWEPVLDWVQFNGSYFATSRGAVSHDGVNWLAPSVEQRIFKAASYGDEWFGWSIQNFKELNGGGYQFERAIYRSIDGVNWQLDFVQDSQQINDFMDRSLWDFGYFFNDGSVSYLGSDKKRYVRTLVDEDGDGISTRYELQNGLDVRLDDADLDADSDGVSNLQEFLDGTSANTADTDGDGLTDSEEKTAGTNPVAVDSDLDGMTDGFEMQYGFDPLLDTDAILDQDGDGFSNLIEFYKGSDPTDINSKPYVASDFNGNGDAEIFWQAGSELSLRLLDDAVANSLLSTQLSSSWKVRARGDFNGDSKTDILWQHKNGLTRVWLMDGAEVVSSADTQSMGSNWKVIGSGDVDGDKKSDLVWYQASSRTVRIWLMDGTSVTSFENLAKKGASGYLPKFVDDFNGDGRADIAWHKAATGHTRFWFMDGATITADTFSSVKQGTSFSLKGSGDFNADGKADLLWCHKDGRTRLWLLDGAEVTASPYTGMAKSLSWKIQQVGDFDGDGSSDLLWVHKKKPTLVHIWHLNSGEVIATDLDADGLTSAQELALGSSDSQQDSDGDGYLDLYESSVIGLDPAVDDRTEDTDSDGLSNIEELLLGSNYNDNDSDSDGLEDGYEAANGLDLLVDDAAGDLDGDGLSNAVEAGLGTRADVADTDGDGLSDSEEVTATTDPLLVDTDSDGMADGYELDYGFDPLLAGEQHLDADSDGFSNLIEFFKGSNPTDINSIPYVVDDFDGDGDAEIFWKAGTTTSIRLLHGVHNYPETTMQLSSSWKPLSRGDYNGDGKADVLWRHKDGRTRVWSMDLFNVIDSADTNLKLSNSWQPVGSGDVNGDGRSDIIWYQASSRSVRIWQMNGAVATSINASIKAAGGYLIKALADVDGNGRDDIVWHKAATGQVRIWSLNDGDVTGDTFTSLKQSTSFSLKGAGDFNADGKSDLLWRHKDGRVRLWLLDGEEVVEAPFASMSMPASWKIRSVADYNGDRKSDLLWFKGGKNQIWYMDGATVSAKDSDADGLDDAFETSIGSSLTQADGDGDGVLDSYEIQLSAFAAGLDPMVDDRVTDTDGDGLSNLQEYGLGTKLNAKDSDSDGLEDGYEAQYGLDPNVDDSALDPDMDGLSNWEEALEGTSPLLADTDTDGISDLDEIEGSGTDPLLADTDSDGMGDEFEWVYGLNPLLDDTLLDNDSDNHSNIKEYYKGSAPNDANSQPYVAGDLDADGDSEVIEANGAGLLLWMFDNDFNTYDAGGAVNESADWQLQGWNDFNGDKKADVVWRHKKTGALRIWMMDGNAVLSMTDVASVKSMSWSLKGLGDFDADGIADVLWQHKTSGKIQLWDMWGATVQQQLNLSSTPSKDYKLQGIGDFNGDFFDDLLLRHKDGRTFVWYLNGSKVTSKRQTSHKQATSKTVEGVGDFNGDGKADMLWRNVYALSIWEMNGHSRQQATSVHSQAHKNELRLDALGDYNGDGHLDMLWRGKDGFVLADAHNAYIIYLDGNGGLAL